MKEEEVNIKKMYIFFLALGSCFILKYQVVSIYCL